MNEVIKQLKARKSVRVFEDKPIASHLKDEILNAAFQAPTAGGMMLYSILDISESIQALCKRKYMSEFSMEMDRSAGEYLKKFRTSK